MAPGQDGGVDPNEIPVVEEIMDGLLHLGPDLEPRSLLGGAQPEVPVIQEELDPVLLGLDRVFGAGPQEPDLAQPHLESPGGTCILPNDPR